MSRLSLTQLLPAKRQIPKLTATIPNALSVVRLILVPVFLWLLLVVHENGWAVAVLMFSGFSDWADGKIARQPRAFVGRQCHRKLDRAVDHGTP